MKINYLKLFGYLVIFIIFYFVGFLWVIKDNNSKNPEYHIKTLMSNYAIKVRAICYNHQEFLIVNGAGTSSNQILDDNNKPKKCDY